MDSGARVRVEVAYARPETQRLVELLMDVPATVRDAINASGLLEEFPELELESLGTGIFSKPAALEDQLKDGDRVEIYRPLVIDPKEARRQRANKGARS